MFPSSSLHPWNHRSHPTQSPGEAGWFKVNFSFSLLLFPSSMPRFLMPKIVTAHDLRNVANTVWGWRLVSCSHCTYCCCLISTCVQIVLQSVDWSFLVPCNVRKWNRKQLCVFSECCFNVNFTFHISVDFFFSFELMVKQREALHLRMCRFGIKNQRWLAALGKWHA